jgi:tetratricopeptide (TPR) repeat protein
MSVAVADPYALGLKLSGQGRHAEAIEHYERALAAKPDDARVLFALGNTARTLGMATAAEELFRRVLVQDPAQLEAIVSLANLLRSRGQNAAAVAILAPALARAPDAPELWLTLGSTFREMGEHARAAEHYRGALAKKPDYVPALVNLADLLADDGAHAEALALYSKAIARAPDIPQARLNRAMLHLLRGDLKDGWRDYQARLKVPGKAAAPQHRLARWDGTTLKRTRLLVSGEQGIGDQIMFASMVPDLAAWAAQDEGEILLECEPRLAALFARSFPGVTVHGWDVRNEGGAIRSYHDWLKTAGGANAFIELGSLARYLRRDLAAFGTRRSFLVPDTEETARWRGGLAKAGPPPYIGVCWRSGNVLGHRALQYAPREAWAAFIARLPGTVVSVQYDAGAEEVAALGGLAGREIAQLAKLDQRNELDRTAAMLATLDAVVSAPTAVAWLAAGTGTATYKVLYDSSWTAFGQAHEPFAPACEVIAPATRGDWAQVFETTLARIGT